MCFSIARTTALAAAMLSAPAGAFEIVTPATTRETVAKIIRHNELELGRGFSFGYSFNHENLNIDQIAAHLESLRLQTASSLPIETFALDHANNIAVGVASTEVRLSIAAAKPTADGFEIVVNATGKKGSFSGLLEEQVGVFDLHGEALRFEVLPLGEAAQHTVHVVLLLDTSGSMKDGPISALKKAAASLLSDLGAIGQNVLCRVVSFSDQVTHHNDAFIPCAKLSNSIVSLRAQGGTDVQLALLTAFQMLSGKDDLAAIVMVTDGRAPIDNAKLQARKTAPVHALWIGSNWFERRKFSGLVDTNLFGASDTRRLISTFFKGFQRSLAGHQVIRIVHPNQVKRRENKK